MVQMKRTIIICALLAACAFGQQSVTMPDGTIQSQSKGGKSVLLTPSATQQAALAKAGNHSMYPDPKFTPGATDPRVTQATINTTICQHGYTATVRSVTQAEKNAVMDRYGFPRSDLSKVEIDHFQSLELAGSNEITNLWPEYYDAAPGQLNYLGARDKDVVETNLGHRICKGTITLDAAIQIIRTDWVAEYKRIKATPKTK
jgi:hypothetical protein